MPRVKTSELEGATLDWAVCKVEGLRIHVGGYAMSWRHCGPIIEREGINLRALRREGHAMHGLWLAAYDHDNTGSMVQWVKREDWPRHYFTGHSPLVAAMRCYVASKLGDEIDIPKSLIS